jgi:hypothetical protein
MIVREPRAKLRFGRLGDADLVENQQLHLEGDAVADHVVAAIDAERLALAVQDLACNPAVDHLLNVGVGWHAGLVLVEIVDEGLAHGLADRDDFVILRRRMKCAIDPEDERSEQSEMQERFARQAYRGRHDKP